MPGYAGVGLAGQLHLDRREPRLAGLVGPDHHAVGQVQGAAADPLADNAAPAQQAAGRGTGQEAEIRSRCEGRRRAAANHGSMHTTRRLSPARLVAALVLATTAAISGVAAKAITYPPDRGRPVICGGDRPFICYDRGLD
ncbi:MAG: hypothetical protein AB1679_09170 [Actinomycetota bacterium]|jgi:hypothetical protein